MIFIITDVLTFATKCTTYVNNAFQVNYRSTGNRGFPHLLDDANFVIFRQ